MPEEATGLGSHGATTPRSCKPSEVDAKNETFGGLTGFLCFLLIIYYHSLYIHGSAYKLMSQAVLVHD